ncbi:histidinol dehydrogenase [Blattabacterium cuenoti]|uniref:histidinol dehydrogenase n=1 Tax=Blattabacterium cuenoti TaxID=1653831 RepID=UPI00163C4E5F|nr:histidinol dehydrogenase [Blattabacterium cuenoti]
MKDGNMVQIYSYPSITEWNSIIKRESLNDPYQVTHVVNSIIQNVEKYGDEAIKKYSKKYDHADITEFRVTEKYFNQAMRKVSNRFKKSVEKAYSNIKYFHKKNILEKDIKIKVSKGVVCWIKYIPIEKVGLYIPGGNAPLLSTILMLGIPALLAKCKNIILCTPPNQDGSIHHDLLYISKYIGIDHVYKVGGAQAIAAMAYGTESIPSVYKIFGPGNTYVTMAKKIISQKSIVSIDMPSGPTEIAIIADNNANPKFVASDLLSQSEHDPESYIILLTINNKLWLNQLDKELKKQYSQIVERKNIVQKSLKNSKIIILSSLKDCIKLVNDIAPEHLIINCKDSYYWANKVINAGSVFLGNYSPVSAGDYATGTNHVLPTYGYAKSYSGISVSSFLKRISFQMISKEGLINLSECIEDLSSEEGLLAHKKSINIRLQNDSS